MNSDVRKMAQSEVKGASDRYMNIGRWVPSAKEIHSAKLRRHA
jgi:hypothetical protein